MAHFTLDDVQGVPPEVRLIRSVRGLQSLNFNLAACLAGAWTQLVSTLPTKVVFLLTLIELISCIVFVMAAENVFKFIIAIVVGVVVEWNISYSSSSRIPVIELEVAVLVILLDRAWAIRDIGQSTCIDGS